MVMVPPSKLIEGKEYWSTKEAIRQIKCKRRVFYEFFRRVLVAERVVYVDRPTKNAPRWYLAEAVMRLKQDDQQRTDTSTPQPLTPDLDWDTRNTMTEVRSKSRDQASEEVTDLDQEVDNKGEDHSLDNYEISEDDFPF